MVGTKSQTTMSLYSRENRRYGMMRVYIGLSAKDCDDLGVPDQKGIHCDVLIDRKGLCLTIQVNPDGPVFISRSRSQQGRGRIDVSLKAPEFAGEMRRIVLKRIGYKPGRLVFRLTEDMFIPASETEEEHVAPPVEEPRDVSTVTNRERLVDLDGDLKMIRCSDARWASIVRLIEQMEVK